MKFQIGDVVHATRTADVDDLVTTTDEHNLQIVDVIGIITMTDEFDVLPYDIDVIHWDEQPSDWWDSLWVSEIGLTLLSKEEYPEYYV